MKKDNNICKSLEQLMSFCPDDKIIKDNLIKSWTIINDSNYSKIVCPISGGQDSDIVIDICSMCDKDKKIEYVWFDTGLEYQATKDHLRWLENKYGVTIKTEKALKPIPTTCRTIGQPFISKYASEMISRLQKHGFKWEDKPYEDLLKEYCEFNQKNGKWRGCVSGLKWWCNKNETFHFNINGNKWLKEFMVENPPTFNISPSCCKYAKKDLIHKIVKENEYDMNITGIRKAEGGIRSTSYKSCFDENISGSDNYRPVFWYLDSTKKKYMDFYDVENSKCYTDYGLKRTGCAGCPYGRDFEFELEVIKNNEPKLFIAVNNIFKESYDYTRKYIMFKEEKNNL